MDFATHWGCVHVLRSISDSVLIKHEHERVGYEPHPIRLTQDELTHVDSRQPLVVKEFAIQALLGENLGISSACHCSLVPSLDELL